MDRPEEAQKCPTTEEATRTIGVGEDVEATEESIAESFSDPIDQREVIPPPIEQDKDVARLNSDAQFCEVSMEQEGPILSLETTHPTFQQDFTASGWDIKQESTKNHNAVDGNNTSSEGTQLNTPASTIIEVKTPGRMRKIRIRPSLRGWQPMSLGDEIEEVFNCELGENYDSVNRTRADQSETSSESGMPALESLESMILIDGEEPEDMLDDSPSRLKWLRQKQDEAEQNEHLDRIMTMIGNEDVKAHFLAVKERMAVAKKWNEDPRKLKFNLVLHEGQRIVIKRIVQLYSKFLFAIEAIPRVQIQRTRGWTMPESTADEHPTVIHFTQADDINQDEQIQHIIKEIQQRRDHIVLVLSFDKFEGGSSHAMKCTVRARRHFPDPIHLGDYSDHELMHLLVRMVKKQSLEVEGGYADPSLRVLVKRALRRQQSGSSSDKIRALEDEFITVCHRYDQRQEQEYLDWARAHPPANEAIDATDETKCNSQPQWPGIKAQIKRIDIFGPEPTDVRDKSEAWKAIQKMVGLEDVKEQIAQLFDRAKINYFREIRGLDPIPLNLNRVFVGEPGVGKTTVAELYAQILAELGIVSIGKVITKNPSDLLATHIGESEEQTKEALRDAMGNILIIDDAHMLYHSSGHGTSSTDKFRDGIIDTIVANVSGKPGEDRCLILVGYKHQMEEMFLNSNPGLQRRFPLDNFMHFDNYNVDQLCQILETIMAEDGNTQASVHAKQVAREVLGRMSSLPRFGNAGDVETLLARARLRQSERLQVTGKIRGAWDAETHGVLLEPQDFDPDYDRSSRAGQNREILFSGFVGFERVINQFRQFQQMADGMRKHEIDPRPHIPWAFIFKGPPGTGKTSTARKVGQLFYDMGFLSSAEVMTCSATDLIGEYQGHTGPKVISQFEAALGKVLFIDEAYRLTAGHGGGSSNFVQEAIGELVDAMTKPRYSGKMVVILAGYTEEMEFLIRSNPGLRSRFPTHVVFPCLEPQQCLQLLRQELSKLTINITGGHSDPIDVEKWKKIYSILAKLSETKGWANGRDIETLAKRIISHVFIKAATACQVSAPEGQVHLAISTDEVIQALQDMLREREGIPKNIED